MSNHTESQPLTQNLGDKILAAQGKPKNPRPETGIDIVEPTRTVPAPSAALVVQSVHNTGDKNNEAEGTATKETVQMSETTTTNGSTETTTRRSRKQADERSFDDKAMDLVERIVDSAEKMADKGIRVHPTFEKRDRVGAIVIGAGIGVAVGGAVGGGVMAFVPATSTASDILAGVAVGGAVGGALGAAGGALYAAGDDEAPKKSKKKSKKDDSDDE